MILQSLAFIIVYVGLCCLLGYLGRNAKFSFWGNFWVSVVLTPLIGIIVLLAQDLHQPRTTPPVSS